MKVGVFTHLVICSCMILLVCVYVFESFLVACVLWVCFGRDSCCLDVVVYSFLEVVSYGFLWVVWGKVIVGPHR